VESVAGSPKSEARRPKEGRNPKPESDARGEIRLYSWASVAIFSPPGLLTYIFRISDFGLPSGLPVSDLGLLCPDRFH